MNAPRGGDVLLTADRSWLSRLIRGVTAAQWSADPDGTAWSHAAILVDGGADWRALEVAPPVCTIERAGYYRDRRYVMLRPPLTAAAAREAARRARSLVGVRYPLAELPAYALVPRLRRWIAGDAERVCSGQVGWCLATAGLLWEDDYREPLEWDASLTPQRIFTQAVRDGWEPVAEIGP